MSKSSKSKKRKLKGWVGLRQLQIYAHHGVYPSEKEEGNTFVLDIRVRGDINTAATTDDLSASIDYEDVASICKEEMKTPSNTLEHVGFRIAKSLLTQLAITRVKLTIAKSNPPIGEPCAASLVTLDVKQSDI